MSEQVIVGSPAVQAPVVRTRLLLAKWYGDITPTVVAAIDETIWEHWDDEDEASWVAEGKRRWGIDPSDCEWRQTWATFSASALAESFATPSVHGEVAFDTETAQQSTPASAFPVSPGEVSRG